MEGFASSVSEFARNKTELILGQIYLMGQIILVGQIVLMRQNYQTNEVILYDIARSI